MSPNRFLASILMVSGLFGTSQALGQQFFGAVRDADTGEPLPGAHVFVAGSLLGAATDRNGRYVIERVPPGSHRVVSSMLGYDRLATDTTLHSGSVEVNFRLEPRVITAGAVEIVAHADPKWAGRLRKFESEFLGETEASAQCRILNPEVLDFEARWWGRLEASASVPLIVENRWLGYRITYHLSEFRHSPALLRYDGDPVFEELQAADKQEEEAWENHRIKAFNGSLRHFFLALLADSTKQHGFHTYRRPSL